MSNNDLVLKFQSLKAKHDELMAEKLKCEARKEQLMTEIKNIQDKYPMYDLSSKESVDSLISDLTVKLDESLKDIEEQYNKIKEIAL